MASDRKLNCDARNIRELSCCTLLKSRIDVVTMEPVSPRERWHHRGRTHATLISILIPDANRWISCFICANSRIPRTQSVSRTVLIHSHPHNFSANSPTPTRFRPNIVVWGGVYEQSYDSSGLGRKEWIKCTHDVVVSELKRKVGAGKRHCKRR